ncbi:MAG: twin-arginine translocase subunit TatC [Gammaproteobacteria bacterium]
MSGSSGDMPFLEHLVELRGRILRALLSVLVLFFPTYYFANEIYAFVAAPLLAHLPENSSMIATEVASPFFTPFKLAAYAALFGAIPYILHQAWAFVSPGLYLHEKRFALPLLFSSVALFYTGMAFAYFLVFPVVFQFFAGITPVGVAMMTDINRYLDFVLGMFFAFGFAFEIPIAVLLMVWTGITTPERLAASRPYVIVGCFVVAMVLTPPDVLSQTLLAVPMWVLFELGVLTARLIERRTAAADIEVGTDVTPPGSAT